MVVLVVVGGFLDRWDDEGWMGVLGCGLYSRMERSADPARM